MDGGYAARFVRRHSGLMEPDPLALQPGHFQRCTDRMVLQRVYYPGLLGDVFAGKRPKVAEDISRKDRRQPVENSRSYPATATGHVNFSRTTKVKSTALTRAADKEQRKCRSARRALVPHAHDQSLAWDVLNGKPQSL